MATPVAEATSQRRSLLPALVTLLLFELVGWSALYAGVDRNVGFGVLFWGLVAMVVATCVVVWIAVRTMAARRFRFFTLRELLVLTVLIGAALGWAGSRFQRTRQQRLIADALVAEGARVYFGGGDEQGLERLLGNEYFNGVTTVDAPSQLSPTHLAALGQLPELNQLVFSGDWPTDAELQRLPVLANLERLYLRGRGGMPVTRSTLGCLKQFPRLISLTLHGSRIEDDALADLKQHRQLKILVLDGVPSSDAVFAPLGQAYSLEQLHFGTIQITDAGLSHLTGLQNLTYLTVSSSLITDAGLMHVAKLRNLKRLSLSGINITDAGLEHLKPLDRLETIYLKGTGVTDDGIRELSKTIPGLRVNQ